MNVQVPQRIADAAARFPPLVRAPGRCAARLSLQEFMPLAGLVADRHHVAAVQLAAPAGLDLAVHGPRLRQRDGAEPGALGEARQDVGHLGERALERLRVLQLGAHAELAVERDARRHVPRELPDQVVVEAHAELLVDRLLGLA